MFRRSIAVLMLVTTSCLLASCGEEIRGEVQLASEELFPPRYLEQVAGLGIQFTAFGAKAIGFGGPFNPIPPDPYPTEITALVAARFASLPGGATVARVFASPNCLPDVVGLGTDTDADGIPDDATVTYTVANCTVYDSATGDAYLGRGTYRVRDTSNSLYGFRVDVVGISVRDYDGTFGVTNQSVFTFTETSQTTTTGGTYHLVLEMTTSSLSPSFQTGMAHKWDITEQFNPVASIPAGGPLTDGILSISGTMDMTLLEDDAPARMKMTIVGQTPLIYDDGCEGFTSGSYEMRLQGAPTEGVHIVFTGCNGYYEPIGAGVL